MCPVSLRPVLWRAALAALGMVTLAICLQLAPAARAASANRAVAMHAVCNGDKIPAVSRGAEI